MGFANAAESWSFRLIGLKDFPLRLGARIVALTWAF